MMLRSAVEYKTIPGGSLCLYCDLRITQTCFQYGTHGLNFVYLMSQLAACHADAASSSPAYVAWICPFLLCFLLILLTVCLCSICFAFLRFGLNSCSMCPRLRGRYGSFYYPKLNCPVVVITFVLLILPYVLDSDEIVSILSWHRLCWLTNYWSCHLPINASGCCINAYVIKVWRSLFFAY